MRGPIARATIRTTAALGLRLVAQAGTLLLVARMLGPETFGALTGVAALSVILGTLATFGTHLVLLGEVSKDPTRRTQILTYALPTTLVCGTALSLAYVLLCTTVLQSAGIPLPLLGMLAVAEILIQPLFALPAAEQQALGRIARSQLLMALPLMFRFGVAATVFLLAPADPLQAYVSGYLAASILAFVIATRAMPTRWPRWKEWRLPRKAQLQIAAGYAALNITAVGPAELDKTLATKLLPLEAAGHYSASARVIGAAMVPVSAMMLSALPRLFREGRSEPERTRRLLYLVLAVATIYSAMLAGLLWITAPAVAMLFGAHYSSLAEFLRWLCFAIPGMALRLSAGSVLMALSRPWMRVAFETAGLAILTLAALILNQRLGASSMAAALTLSEWTMALVGWAMVRSSVTNPSRASRLPRA